MAIARDLMRPCGSVAENAIVADIFHILSAENSYCLAVLNAQGKLSGIITEFDLVKLIYESGVYDVDVAIGGRLPVFLGLTPEQLRELTASDIMTSDPDSVSPDTTDDELIKTMFRNKRKVMLVTDHGRVVGVVHRLDVVKKVLG